MAGPLLDRVRLAAVLWLEPLDDRARVDPRLGDVERSARGDVALVRVGHGAADHLFDHPAGTLLGEAEHRNCIVHVAAADQVDDQPSLPRGDAGETVFSLESHLSTFESIESSNHSITESVNH